MHQDLLSARQAWFATPPRTVTKAEVLGTEAAPLPVVRTGRRNGADLDCRQYMAHEVDVPSACARGIMLLSSVAGRGGHVELAGNVQRLGPYECVVLGASRTRHQPRLAEIG